MSNKQETKHLINLDDILDMIKNNPESLNTGISFEEYMQNEQRD